MVAALSMGVNLVDSSLAIAWQGQYSCPCKERPALVAGVAKPWRSLRIESPCQSRNHVLKRGRVTRQLCGVWEPGRTAAKLLRCVVARKDAPSSRAPDYSSHVRYLAENFCPWTIGWSFLTFSALLLPHMAHAFALYAHLWQYFLPCSVFVLHVSHELE